MSDINGSLETISSFLSKYLPAIFKFMIVTFFLQNENFFRGLHGFVSVLWKTKKKVIEESYLQSHSEKDDYWYYKSDLIEIYSLRDDVMSVYVEKLL